MITRAAELVITILMRNYAFMSTRIFAEPFKESRTVTSLLVLPRAELG